VRMGRKKMKPAPIIVTGFGGLDKEHLVELETFDGSPAPKVKGWSFW